MHYLDFGVNYGNMRHSRLTIQDDFHSPQTGALTHHPQVLSKYRKGSHKQDWRGFVPYLYDWIVQVLLYRSRTVPLRHKEMNPLNQP